jgi:hypothetical protein
MASAWGLSWGSAWGNAWGQITTQTYGATNYLRAIRKKHKLPEPTQDFTLAVARALELELRLRAEKQAAERELEAEKRRIAALRKPQEKQSEEPKTAPNSDFVAKQELLRYKIRQYDAELDSLRNYEIGARLLAIQTERVAAAKDAQDMEDILMILALDEA